jgi:hypothetical protein
MTSMKALGLVIGIAFAASSFVLAQQDNPTNNPAPQQANPTNPAASGTQQANPTNNPAAGSTSPRTGSAANRQKHNRRLSAVSSNRRLAARRRAARRLYAFQPSPRCRFVQVGSNLFRRICR